MPQWRSRFLSINIMAFTPPILTADVKEVAELVSVDLTVHINTADLIVTENLAESGHSDARLRLIGIYLAAHYGFIQEGQIKSEKIGDSSTTFNLESGQALSSTTHGQQALLLDTSGTLANLNDKATNGTPGGIAALTIY